MSDTWNAEHYLKYGQERTRAAADLMMRIRLAEPTQIVDLGCGPGNSTQILRDRWPHANLLGIDNSVEMIASATRNYPDLTWQISDCAKWVPEKQFDLVFSNAALQWIPNHGTLIPRLFTFVAPGGALAFQIPSKTYALVRTLIHEVSLEPQWNDRMAGARDALTMQSPSFYYDALCGDADAMDIWETEYIHVMDSQDAVVDWIASTGLRPFLQTLSDESERQRFVDHFRQRVRESYDVRPDGKVLFPFLRTFVIAYHSI